MFSSLVGWDYLVIAIYFLVVFLIAGWAIFHDLSIHKSTAGYFLAGKNTGWFVVGASLFASNIGSEHLVGLAGSGVIYGVAAAQFEIFAALILILLGWLFVPFYLKNQVYTIPEFIENRYSPAARAYLSWMSVVAYILTKISVTIAAGGIIFETLIGINFWTGAFIVIVITGVYTVLGGLRAVMYTDMIQMFVLLIGAVVLTVSGLIDIGGWVSLKETAGSSFFNMWKPVTDPNFPWTGIIFGAPILGIWYWCTDQFIVQRTLAARNVDEARRGAIFGGFLKILPVFIFVVPGIIAYVLIQRGHIELAEADHALPALVGFLLPAGLRGLVVAGLLAALMSSLSSVFNSCSTLITFDIYKKLVPNASEKQLILAGQVATGLLVILALLWIPVLNGISTPLYQYLQSIQAYISPPIVAIFFLGIFIKRLNSRGAMASLFVGFIFGITRLISEINKDSLSGYIHDYATLNFLHFAIYLFVVCSAVLVLVSFTAPAPSSQKLNGVTFSPGCLTPADSCPKHRLTDMRLTLVLCVLAFLVWIYFTG
ncbi:MAG: sodium transporter [Calditrichaeota bacterium]|nr:MAG: sodium transporter [Calditrichota bacterium]